RGRERPHLRRGGPAFGRVAGLCCRCHCSHASGSGSAGRHEGVSRAAKTAVDRETGKAGEVRKARTARRWRAGRSQRRKMIRKVLIANRGEIAVRVSHTLREMGISTAGVFTEPDERALHVLSVDEAYPVASYLDIEDIVRTAKQCAADAIHPGYGFLSENARFSAACEANSLTFIGPRPETIRAMGDKLES